jgi:PAS domain S-box-containing protein
MPRPETSAKDNEVRPTDPDQPFRPAALEAAGIGAFEWDLRTGRVELDACGRRIFGFPSAAALCAADLLARISQDDRGCLTGPLEADRPDAPLSIELRIQPPQVATRTVLCVGRVARDAANKAQAVLGVFVDVTGRTLSRAHDSALLELGGPVREIADPDEIARAAGRLIGHALGIERGGYATLDPLGRTLSIGGDYRPEGARALAQTYDVSGLGPCVEALQRGQTLAIDDCGQDPRTAACAAALRAAGFRAFMVFPAMEDGAIAELLFVAQSTPRRWSQEDLRFFREAAARTRGAVGHRELEQELRQSAADLEQQVAARTAERDRLWRYSRDIMLVMDADGIALATNPALTRILGWLPAEVAGRNVIDLIHPEDHDIVLSALAELTAGERTHTGESSAESDVFEIRCQHKTGRYDWISWVAGFERADARTIYATGRLITGEKAAAAELFLAQEALRQSQKLEAMGQLTGGVAHDFNNLLTPIIGGLDMLQRREIGGEREQRLIDGALQSAERAKILVQRLLAFARRQPLQATAIDIAELFRGLRELITSTAGPRIRVDYELDPDLPPARADANQLEMALLNLAVNARDAMPGGGVLVMSASRREVMKDSRHHLPPGEYVAIGVADTGVGMDEETLRRCIEPFFSTKGLGRGTGLGLSMVHGLASQLGGALEIDSAPGHGARIRLWLPVGEAAAAGLAGAPFAPQARRVRGRALVVDDEDLVRASTAEMLTELGYEVVEADCAKDALVLLEGPVGIDLLVTDHMMPGMTGVELAHAVREKRPHARVLIISGYAEVEGLAPDLPRLAKPFRQTDLAATLSRLDADAVG